MPSGPAIILTLKILVVTVTVLFLAALIALRLGRTKLHGRINLVFGILTLLTVFGFELLLRLGSDVTSQFSEEARKALRIHLFFSIPAAVILPIMMFTGLKHRRTIHVSLGVLFTLFWVGTFITGVFFLPHE
jgi:uncharacterized membrane protein YozB (DUF420 family)